MARATCPACRAPRAPSAGAATRESRSRCTMGSLAPPLPRPDQPQVAGRRHSSATEQGRAHAPHPSAWPVFESISTQTRHRRLSTRHKERQAAPNRLLSPSPPSQALSKRFSRAPGPLRVVHRSPTSTGQAPVLWARTAGRSAIIVSPRRRQNGRCFSESTDATGSPLNSLTNEKSLI